jgi:hypothetical protein
MSLLKLLLMQRTVERDISVSEFFERMRRGGISGKKRTGEGD